MTTESNQTISLQYAELMKKMLMEKGNYGDNYWLELRINRGKSAINNLIGEINILYSRHSSGGAYQSLCLASMTTDEIIIYRYPRYDKRDGGPDDSIEQNNFRLGEPNCFNIVVEFIVREASKMQRDRLKRPFGEPAEPPYAWFKDSDV